MMKRLYNLIKILLPLFCFICNDYTAYPSDYNTMWRAFVSPPDSTRTKLWWFHGETETTEEGIDADLDAFKSNGIGGVVFYDQVHSTGNGAFPSMSGSWWKMLRHAAIKARDLGMTFEVAASNGYVAGGPWITPGLGMKRTEIIDTILKSASEEISLKIPQPKEFIEIATVAFPASQSKDKISFYKNRITVSGNDTLITLDNGTPITLRGISYQMQPRGKGSTGSMNVPCLPSPRYCGAKYIDYPPVGALEYSEDGITWSRAVDLLPLENNIGHKSRRRSISFPAITGKYFRLNIKGWKGSDNSHESIWLDNIELYTHDIVDNLEVKTGLRTEVTYPSATGGDIGAVDSKSIVNLTGQDSAVLPEGLWHIVKMGYVPTGAKTKHGRRNLLGLEADVMSAKAARIHFDNYFKPICDTLAAIGAKPIGMCMDSHEGGIQNWTSGFEKVLEERLSIDFYKRVPIFAGYIVGNRSETDDFLALFRENVAQAIADNFYATLSKLCSAHGVDFTSQAMLNIVNDNLASRGRASKPQGEFWTYQTNGNFDCLDAASAAHLYGHRIASAEAFTDTPYSTPTDSLLMIANIAYCRGINEFAVCASSYQPWTDRKYDDSSSGHPYVFHRHNPKWADMKPFWDYQARCAYMLRQGKPIVDLCVYAGDDFPVKTFAFRLPLIPEGYNFDLLNHESLVGRLDVDISGDIIVDGGMRYKVLVVKASDVLTESSRQAVNRLEEKGAKIIRCDRGEDVAERLHDFGIAPDIYVNSAGLPDDRLMFFHRELDGNDIYFLYNHSEKTYTSPLQMRSHPQAVEIWDPAKPERRKVNPADALTLPPHKAIFIISCDSTFASES